MAETSIGRAALLFGVDSKQLKTGLNSVGGFIKSAAKDWQGLMTSAGGMAVSGLKAGLVGLAGVGVAGLGTFTAATLEAKETLLDLTKTATAGGAFGLDIASGTGIFGLAKSAGSDVRSFTEALSTMSSRASDTGEVAATMFKGLGLEASKFAALRTDDQFYAIFDALTAVQNPAERVRLLMLAFGEDEGKTLLPLLGKTATELRAMAVGFSVSAAEMVKMAGASSALTKMEGAFTKLKNKLAVAASPFIESVANAISGIDVEGLGSKFEKIYSVATSVFERLKDFASDQFSKLSADLDGWLTKTVQPATKAGSDPKGNPAVSQFARSVADFGRYTGKLLGNTVDTTSGVWNAYSYMFDSVAGSVQTNLGKLVGSRTMEQEGALLEAKALQRLDQAGKDFGGNTGDKWGKAGEQLGLTAGQTISEVVDKALNPTVKLNSIALDIGLSAAEAAMSAATSATQAAENADKGKKSEDKFGSNTAYRAGTADELAFRLRAMAPQGDLAKMQLAEAKKHTQEVQKQTAAIVQFLGEKRGGYAIAD